MRVATGEYLIHLVATSAITWVRWTITAAWSPGTPRGVDAIRTAELSTARPVAD